MSISNFFACPVCVSTLVPGAKLTYPRATAEKGAGKVWDLSGGAPQLVECARCKGTGMLEDLRQRSDRRQRIDRRTDSGKRTSR
ncbi:MAG: hypothetical protein M3010_05430 [Candidatus Dormibacteraeota bacterium]|nr:hypothetical protein [Candidatus Dormibacteraeota bacterium]